MKFTYLNIVLFINGQARSIFKKSKKCVKIIKASPTAAEGTGAAMTTSAQQRWLCPSLGPISTQMTHSLLPNPAIIGPNGDISKMRPKHGVILTCNLILLIFQIFTAV
jgi:hypothetical protein